MCCEEESVVDHPSLRSSKLKHERERKMGEERGSVIVRKQGVMSLLHPHL